MESCIFISAKFISSKQDRGRRNIPKAEQKPKIVVTVKTKNGEIRKYSAEKQVRMYFKKAYINKNLVDVLEQRARINQVKFFVNKGRLIVQ